MLSCFGGNRRVRGRGRRFTQGLWQRRGGWVRVGGRETVAGHRSGHRGRTASCKGGRVEVVVEVNSLRGWEGEGEEKSDKEGARGLRAGGN
eukprot:761694-Hanusia_phi.AAC.1